MVWKLSLIFLPEIINLFMFRGLNINYYVLNKMADIRPTLFLNFIISRFGIKGLSPLL